MIDRAKDAARTACYLIDGQGGGKQIGFDEAAAIQPGSGQLVWIHADVGDPVMRKWIMAGAGIAEPIARMLTADTSRPRFDEVGDGAALALRGINTNPDAEPEDMVSIRLHVSGDRILSAGHRHLLALDDLRADLAAGTGFRTAGGFVSRLSIRLLDRIAEAIDDLEERAALLEEQMLAGGTRFAEAEEGGKLGILRAEVIALRRFLNPQRDALTRLSFAEGIFGDPRHKAAIREAVERTHLALDALDALDARGAVVQDEIRNRLSTRMNRVMYQLTIVATIVLPLNLLTGMLGTNIGGIPGARNENAFMVLAIVVAAVCAAAIGYLWRRRDI